MKLIFCPECTDIRKLHKDGVKCWCRKSWGRYLEDNHKAEIGGQAVAIGIDNDDFVGAYRLKQQRPLSKFNDFFTFFFPEGTENITKEPCKS
jgi:hypothetical protein